MAVAKRRQRLLPLEVARDAIREGRPPAEVVAAASDAAEVERLQLALELIRAGMELLGAVSVWHVNTFIHATGTRSIELVVRESVLVDLIYQALCTFRDRDISISAGHADPNTSSFSGDSTRRASVSVGGIRVDLRGPTVQRCARKASAVDEHGEVTIAQCTGENGHDGDHTFDGGQP